MARATFGGTTSDFVYTTAAGGLMRAAAGTVYLWTAETGGAQVTDLLLAGNPVTTIPVGSDGQIPDFSGPDNVYELWASVGSTGVRVKMLPVTQDFARKPDGIADGQTMLWDAIAGRFLAVNPSGESLVAQAINDSNTATDLSAAVTAIPLTAISVEPSNGRPVTLRWQGKFIQSAAGRGVVFLALYETTAGAVLRCDASGDMPNTATLALSQVILSAALPLGAVASTRTFELRAFFAVDSGSPDGSILNTPTNPTFLQAFAG